MKPRRSKRGVAVAFLPFVLFGTSVLAVSSQDAGTRPSALPTAEIAKRQSGAVVTITTPEGQGSGVIIDPAGVVVTNLHVIRGQTEVSVKLANGDVYDSVEVIDVDDRKDVVLLKLKAFALNTAPLGNSEQVQVGHRVVVIGSPQGLERTVSDGVVSAIRDSGEGYRLFQTNAAASKGSSGGGMFNEFGELIGIVTAKLESGENLNFAVPVNYVRGLSTGTGRMSLTELAKRYPPLPSTPPPAAAAQTATPTPRVGTTDVSRLSAVLDATKIRYSKVSDTSWSVAYDSKELPGLTVYLSAYGELAVVQTVVAEMPKLTPAQLTELLRLNFGNDLGKASLDDDGDLVVLNESPIRVLDAEALIQLLDSVANFAESVAKSLNGSSIKPETAPSLSFNNRARLTSLSLLQGHAMVRYDPSTWKPQQAETPDDYVVHQFAHATEPIWIRIISERLEIPVAKLPDIALKVARDANQDVRRTRLGARSVNGKAMSFQEFETAVNDIPVTMYAHYYSDSSGSIQIVGWTGRSLVSEARKHIEIFVSGFDITSGR